MLIYEVNIEVNHKVIEEYRPWLKKHISEMLTFDGFLQAKVFEENSTKVNSFLVVHYYINSEEELNQYFRNHAERMRNEAVTLFKKSFTAKRRILKGIYETS